LLCENTDSIALLVVFFKKSRFGQLATRRT
jgi:hypothetical protein